MQPATRALWKRLFILATILPVTGFIAFYAVIFIGGAMEQAWHSAPPVESSGAKALIFVPDSSPNGFALQLVGLPAAAQFLAEHPGATFLIPRDQQRAVEEQFGKSFDHATLGMGQTPSGDQQITLQEFTLSGDSDGFRYVAYKDRIASTEYCYISDRGGMGFLFLSMTLVVFLPLILGLVSVIWMLRRWRRECRAGGIVQPAQPVG